MRVIETMEYEQIISNFLRNIPHSESDYQERIVSFIISLGLGWTNDEIKQQLTISIGSTQRVIPDIAIISKKLPQFVIEVKSAHHLIQEKDVKQLLSYMKQLEVNVGIYFGEKIIVYYKDFGINSQPIAILEVSLNVEDKYWSDFFELFHKCKYDIRNISRYVESVKIKRHNDAIVDDYIRKLVSDNEDGILQKALWRYFEDENLEKSLIESILSGIKIHIDIKKSTKEEASNIPLVSETNAQVKDVRHRKKDKAIFSIDKKGEYGCGDLALKIVDMISHRPDINFNKLQFLFNTWRENIISLDNLAEWKKKHHKDSKKDSRWFEKDIILSNDNIKFLVTTQWGIHNIHLIIQVGEKMGLTIDRIQ